VLKVTNFAPLCVLLLGPLSWWGAPAGTSHRPPLSGNALAAIWLNLVLYGWHDLGSATQQLVPGRLAPDASFDGSAPARPLNPFLLPWPWLTCQLLLLC
jgi:hypothetical protein